MHIGADGQEINGNQAAGFAAGATMQTPGGHCETARDTMVELEGDSTINKIQATVAAGAITKRLQKQKGRSTSKSAVKRQGARKAAGCKPQQNPHLFDFARDLIGAASVVSQVHRNACRQASRITIDWSSVLHAHSVFPARDSAYCS